MLSTFDIVGDTSVETLQRIQVAISDDSAESSKCYIRIQGGSGNVRWVNYDMNDVPFHIVAPMVPLGKLMIADVVGVKSSYEAPAILSATIKATKPDGTPADSSEFLNVQVYVNYAHPNPSGASGPGVGDNATYNPSTGLWQWTAPKALPAGDYVLKVVLYCSMTGSKCIWQYGNMNQVEKSIPFTVGYETSPSPTPYPTPTYTSTPMPTITPYNLCSVWPRQEIIDPNKIYTISEICDGDLIRAQGDIAVYIVKIKNNKRFIRRFFGPQIFKAYGHLNFSKVKNVSKETLSLFSNSPYVKLHNMNDVKWLGDVVPGMSAKLYRTTASEIDDDSVFIVNDAEYKLYRH